MSTLDKKFHVIADHASIVRIDPTQLRDALPAGIYSVNFNPMMGFSLSLRNSSFELPEVLFGDVDEKVERLMKRYKLNGEISALLSGAKGSGKTLLAHAFCNKAIADGKAVVIVDQSFGNPVGLKEFLGDIGDAVFIFDEFAKTFDEEDQKAMLDFFSGSNYNKRATFVIENRYTDINEFMLDRPGRMRFHFKYAKLSLQVAKEVCEHNKLSLELTKLILNYAARSYTIGMDTLSRLIEECIIDEINDKDTFDSLVEDLNIPTNRDVEYKIESIKFNDKEFSSVGINNINVSASRINGNFYNCDNHPLMAELREVAKDDEKLAAKIDNITHDHSDDDEVEELYTDWSSFYVGCGRPTFAMNGSITFIDRESGIQFNVIEDFGDELGNILDLMV